MMQRFNHYILDLMIRFQTDEEGLALTEYLLLLGLLTGAVILAVVAFGDALADAWEDWVTFMESVDDRAPAPLT